MARRINQSTTIPSPGQNPTRDARIERCEDDDESDDRSYKDEEATKELLAPHASVIDRTNAIWIVVAIVSEALSIWNLLRIYNQFKGWDQTDGPDRGWIIMGGVHFVLTVLFVGGWAYVLLWSHRRISK